MSKTTECNRILNNASTPARYFQWLQKLAEENTAPAKPETPDAPFLSVLMRTQGKRYETLKEALLSLEAQSDQNFEIVLILHCATEEDKKETASLLESLTPTLKSRLTYRALDTGTRAAPLNLALSLARGHYVAILDDDDVVFENWVENFHRLADRHDGAVIRCYGMTQYWSADAAPAKKTCLQSLDAPHPTYCVPFDLQAHLSDNHTPISCMALPRTCYSLFGIAFDETLTTAEDWDFLMRCVLLCGLYDTKEITFLYRLWQNAENSHTLHREDEWLKNRNYIMEKLNQIPFITSGIGGWTCPPVAKTEEDAPLLVPTFKQRLKAAIRKHGFWRLPFVAMRKIFCRLFG